MPTPTPAVDLDALIESLATAFDQRDVGSPSKAAAALRARSDEPIVRQMVTDVLDVLGTVVVVLDEQS